MPIKVVPRYKEADPQVYAVYWDGHLTDYIVQCLKDMNQYSRITVNPSASDYLEVSIDRQWATVPIGEWVVYTVPFGQLSGHTTIMSDREFRNRYVELGTNE